MFVDKSHIYQDKNLKTNKKISIEIEDIDGSTIGGINLNTGEYGGFISLADCDEDYLFDTDNTLIRIQLKKTEEW